MNLDRADYVDGLCLDLGRSLIADGCRVPYDAAVYLGLDGAFEGNVSMVLSVNDKWIEGNWICQVDVLGTDWAFGCNFDGVKYHDFSVRRLLRRRSPYYDLRYGRTYD